MATMNIIQAMNRLRSDIQTWVANNLKTKVNADDLSTSVTTGTISANQILINGDDVKTALTNLSDTKQDEINDLATIRENASKGATANSWGNHANVGYAKSTDVSNTNSRIDEIEINLPTKIVTNYSNTSVNNPTIALNKNSVGGVQFKGSGTITISSNASGEVTIHSDGITVDDLDMNAYLTKDAASATYKPLQNAVADPTISNGSSTEFISNISQDKKGVISATKKSISVGNGKITITQNGTEVGSFTMNQSGNGTIDLTDTTYNLVSTKNTTGLVKNGSDVTSTTGYTACPIVNGIPYYKDTDNDTKSFTITASANDDDVVVLSGTNGTNATTYTASHAKTFGNTTAPYTAKYTSGNSTTSISGYGASKTIKIPQITVDEYGHVRAGSDESVTIIMPSEQSIGNGTITIKMNGSSKGTFTMNQSSDKTIDLGTVITSHQDISGKADKSEIVDLTSAQSISGLKTFTQGPVFTGSGDESAILIGDNTRINVNGTTRSIFGFVDSTADLTVGNAEYNLKLRGKGSRPKFNNNDLALKSDIPNMSTYATQSWVSSEITKVATGGQVTVPVEDVQVNGSSVVTNKIANITIPAEVTKDTVVDWGFKQTDNNSVTGITVGNSGTTSNNSATNPYIKIKDDSTHRGQIQLKGSGLVNITSDANGTVTIKGNSPDLSNYKTKQSAISANSSGNGIKFVDTISQDANGKITVTTKNVSFPDETDPVFSASPAAGISSTDIANWNGKVSQGDLDTYATQAWVSSEITKVATGGTVSVPVEDVQVNGNSVVANKIANIDLSGYAKTIKINGANVSANGGIIDIGNVASKELGTPATASAPAIPGLLAPAFIHTSGTVTLPTLKTSFGNFTIQPRSSVSNRYYGIEIDKATATAYVNVPWTDTSATTLQMTESDVSEYRPILFSDTQTMTSGNNYGIQYGSGLTYNPYNNTLRVNCVSLDNGSIKSGVETDISVTGDSSVALEIKNSNSIKFDGGSLYPDADDMVSLGDETYRWETVYGHTGSFNEILTHKDILYFGKEGSADIKMTYDGSSFYPATNNGLNLGNGGCWWKNAFIKEKVYLGTTSMYLSGASNKITINASSGTYCAGGFYESSDEKLKKFTGEVEVDFDKLKKIPKSYFTWNSDEEQKLHLGTSAQKLQEVYPELVTTDADGNLTVSYNKLSVVALKAVDVLDDRCKELENKNKELEERLSKLESLIANLK